MATCPTNCDACPQEFIITITGAGGKCAVLNGEWTVPHIETEQCTWRFEIETNVVAGIYCWPDTHWRAQGLDVDALAYVNYMAPLVGNTCPPVDNSDWSFEACSCGGSSCGTMTVVGVSGPEAGPYTLKYRKGGSTVEITTYVEDPAGWNQTLAIRANNTTYYAQCDSNLSHANASDLRVRIGGTTYAVLTTAGTPT